MKVRSLAIPVASIGAIAAVLFAVAVTAQTGQSEAPAAPMTEVDDVDLGESHAEADEERRPPRGRTFSDGDPGGVRVAHHDAESRREIARSGIRT